MVTFVVVAIGFAAVGLADPETFLNYVSSMQHYPSSSQWSWLAHPTYLLAPLLSEVENEVADDESSHNHTCVN